MAIDWIGQFRETTGIARAPSIRSQAGVVANELRGPVADYLDAGLLIGAVPGLERDVLGGPDYVLPASLLSDGRYVWRAFLGHYVRTYGVAVPPDLIELATSGVRPEAVLDHAVETEIGDWLRRQIADGTLA